MQLEFHQLDRRWEHLRVRGNGGCWPRPDKTRPSWWWRPKGSPSAIWSSTVTSASRRRRNWAGTLGYGWWRAAGAFSRCERGANSRCKLGACR